MFTKKVHNEGNNPVIKCDKDTSILTQRLILSQDFQGPKGKNIGFEQVPSLTSVKRGHNRLLYRLPST